MTREAALTIVPNPAFADRAPEKLGPAACHDGTPFLTTQCPFCGVYGHWHESQLATVPRDAKIATKCHNCGATLLLAPGAAHDAFAQMRAAGWIE